MIRAFSITYSSWDGVVEWRPLFRLKRARGRGGALVFVSRSDKSSVERWFDSDEASIPWRARILMRTRTRWIQPSRSVSDLAMDDDVYLGPSVGPGNAFVGRRASRGMEAPAH